MSIDLETLHQNATTVALRAGAIREAKAREAEAGKALLTAVLAKVGTEALRGIATRPVIRERMWWPDSVSTDSETTRASWAGICVAGQAKPTQDHPRANTGDYEGDGLFLVLEDGLISWRCLGWGGTWSRWQGASSEAEAAETPLTIDEVARTYDVPAIVTTLAEAFAKAANKGNDVAERLVADAEKMHNLALLICGGAE